MKTKHMLSGISIVLILATLTACGGSGSSTPAPVQKAWGTAVLIETDNAGDADSTQIAFDTNGNGLAVWAQSDGTRGNIWANRHTVGSGWGTAEMIETDNAGGAGNPQIAIDASGNAMVIWTQWDGTRDNLWARRYSVSSSTWGAVTLVETNDAGNAQSPQIASDASGNVIAVWSQGDASIWINRYTASSSTWGTPALIENAANPAQSPQIAIDGSGNALAVWSQQDGTQFSIWANRYTASSGTWGTAALIEADNAGFAVSPQIAIDTNGNALAVWVQSDGTRRNIWSNHYTISSGWGTAEMIETDNAGDAGNPQIAIDTNGNALAVWEQTDGTRYNIWSNRYSAGSGWGAAVLVESDNAGHAGQPQIAIDASGNAIAVWYQWDGTRYSIWANRYSAGSGWGAAALIEADNSGGAFSSQISIDASGNAIAVWEQADGTHYSIWANRYQ